MSGKREAAIAAVEGFADLCRSRRLSLSASGHRADGRGLVSSIEGAAIRADVVKSLGSYRIDLLGVGGNPAVSISMSRGVPVAQVDGIVARIEDPSLSLDLSHALGAVFAAAENARGDMGRPCSVWAARPSDEPVPAFVEADGSTWFLLGTDALREEDRERYAGSLGTEGGERWGEGHAYLSLRSASGEWVASCVVDTDGVLELVDADERHDALDIDREPPGGAEGSWLGPATVARRLSAGNVPTVPLGEGMHRTDEGWFLLDGSERLHNTHGPAIHSDVAGTLGYYLSGASIASDRYAATAAALASAAGGSFDGWMAERVAVEEAFVREAADDLMFELPQGRVEAQAVMDALSRATVDTVEEISTGIRELLGSNAVPDFSDVALARGWIVDEKAVPAHAALAARAASAPFKVVTFIEAAPASDGPALLAAVKRATTGGGWGELSDMAAQASPPTRSPLRRR